MSFSKNSFSFDLPSRNEPDTFEARVQWAIKARQTYVFKDNDEVGARVRRIDDDDDEEDIREAQRVFEKRYRENKLKLQEKEKEAAKEMADDLEQLFKKHPHLRDQIQPRKEKSIPAKEVEKPTSTPRPMVVSSSKRRHTEVSASDCSDDEEETVVPASKKSKKDEITTSFKGGPLYSTPCDHCAKGDYECREQIPPKRACYQCRRMRSGCSFLGRTKIIRKGSRKANGADVVKKPEVEAESEEVESESEVAGSRQCHSEVACAIREQTARIATELTDIGSILKKIDERQRSQNEQLNTVFNDLRNLFEMVSGVINPVEVKKTAVMTSSSSIGSSAKAVSSKPIKVADRQRKGS